MAYRKLQLRRGAKASLPTLASGELGFCTDTKEVYVGDGSTNTLVGGATNNTALAGKVDKVEGKGLSTNDYDSTAKGKVDNLPSDTNTALENKVDKVSGKGLSTNDYDATAKGKVDNLPSDTNTALGNKVDKVTGKGLSTNDYTTTEKNKLSGIAEGATANTVLSKTATLSTTWAGSAAPYTQTVTVSDIKSPDTPILDLVTSTSNYETEQTEWAKIFKAVAGNGTITFYAKEKTTTALTVNVQVNR